MFTKHHMKKKKNIFYATAMHLVLKCHIGTYSLNAQVDQAGSRGEENVTDHVSCVKTYNI